MATSHPLNRPRIAAALIVAVCLPLQARAQLASGLANCRQLLDSLPALDPASRAAAAVSAPDADTCRFAPVRFAAGPVIGYTVDSLSIKGLGAGAAMLPGKPVRLEAHSVRVAPTIPNPVAAYITRVGAIPFDVAVELVSDPAAGRFTLREFSMTGEGVGVVHAAAALTDVKVAAQPLDTPMPLASDPTAIGLASLSLEIDNHGFVERMITPAVAGYVASSMPQADPETAIEAGKQQIEGFIGAMPALYGLPQPTADALVRFVGDFPHPAGSLKCSLAADPPVHLPADGQPDPAAIRALITAAHPSCTYAKG